MLSVRKQNKLLLGSRNGLVVTLPTLLSLYLGGAGLVFLVCVRTFVAFHMYLISPTLSLNAISDIAGFTSHDRMELNVPIQFAKESIEFLPIKQKEVEFVEAGERWPDEGKLIGGSTWETEETGVATDMNSRMSEVEKEDGLRRPLHLGARDLREEEKIKERGGYAGLQNKDGEIGGITRETVVETGTAAIVSNGMSEVEEEDRALLPGIRDLREKEKIEEGAREPGVQKKDETKGMNEPAVGKQSTVKILARWNGELEGVDLRMLLHDLSAGQRQKWLKKNWPNFRILQSDAISDKFSIRMKRFLNGHNEELGRGDEAGENVQFFRTYQKDRSGGERGVAVGNPHMNSSHGAVRIQASSDYPYAPRAVGTELPSEVKEVAKRKESTVESGQTTNSHGEGEGNEGVRRLKEEENSERISEGGGKVRESFEGAVPRAGYKCRLRIFMTWISPLSSFGPRERLSLESVFKLHPTACVIILSRALDTEEGREILQPFVERGLRVMAVSPNLHYLFKDTPAEQWFHQLKEGRQDPGDINFSQNLSNILRLVALYKYGGIYLDSDVIVLKDLSSLSNVIGAQSIDSQTGQWSRLNNAVMAFDKRHPVLYKFIQEFARTFNGSKWGHNGPYLVTRVVKRVLDRPGYAVSVMPPSAFYPVTWAHIDTFFHTAHDQIERRWQVGKMDWLERESYTVHLWNRESRRLQVERGSIMEHIFQACCIFCDEQLHNAALPGQS